MKLCMFHPNDRPMERGWVGRVDGDTVVHLAAQTLQSFFLGGGRAREHAEYPLDDVTFLVPVQYPPTVRVFEAVDRFAFANTTAVVGPGIPVPRPAPELAAAARIAAVIGAAGEIGGFTGFVEWQAPRLPPPKNADFGLVLGPVVVTPDELDAAAAAGGFDWQAAARLAARATRLRPGDILASPALVVHEDLADGIALELAGIGILDCPLGDAV